MANHLSVRPCKIHSRVSLSLIRRTELIGAGCGVVKCDKSTAAAAAAAAMAGGDITSTVRVKMTWRLTEQRLIAMMSPCSWPAHSVIRRLTIFATWTCGWSCPVQCVLHSSYCSELFHSWTRPRFHDFVSTAVCAEMEIYASRISSAIRAVKKQNVTETDVAAKYYYYYRACIPSCGENELYVLSSSLFTVIL